MRDLNRWNPEAFSILGIGVGSWIGTMLSAEYQFLPGVIVGTLGVVASFVWMLTYLHRAAKQNAPCKHPNVSHYTAFGGLEDLRALFSGKMTCEEYSKKAEDPLIESWTTCNSCGAKWRR